MAAGEERGYDAFISYSHRLDADITARLQTELQRFAKPWYRVRALHLFRDQTSLAASPHLWTTIEEALADCGWLILIASPESAQSSWVAREIAWWRAHRPMNHVLIAVTRGELVWDEAAGDLDWSATTALSKEALGHGFAQEPRWVDLRWARDSADSLRSADPRLQDAVADLAAAIRQVPKDTLIGEHIRHRRRTVQAAVAVAAALVVLLAFSLTAAFIAKAQQDRADQENTVATAGLLASTAVSLTSSQPDLAQLFAVQAYRLDPGNPQTRAALFTTVQADPQVQRFLQAPGPVSALSVSPNGRIVVAGTRNGWVRGWNLSTFRAVTYGRMTGPVTAVAASADGTTVAAATSLAARTWTGGRVIASRAAPAGTRFTAAGVSPSGRYAAFAAFPDLDVLSTTGRSWRQARLRGFGTGQRGRPPLVTNLAVPSNTELVALDGRWGSWRRLALPGLTATGSARDTFGLSRYPAYTYALSPSGRLFTHSYVAAGSSLRVLSTRGSRPGRRPARRAAGPGPGHQPGRPVDRVRGRHRHPRVPDHPAHPAGPVTAVLPGCRTAVQHVPGLRRPQRHPAGLRLREPAHGVEPQAVFAHRPGGPGAHAVAVRPGLPRPAAVDPARRPGCRADRQQRGPAAARGPRPVVREDHHPGHGRDRGVRAAAVEPDREPALRVRPDGVGRHRRGDRACRGDQEGP